jgi:ADP-heptose:LPS heptosyltransferase
MSSTYSSNTPIDSHKPIRCLVVQFSRLSDTIQSLMALRAAKQLYPNLEIHFVARDSFSAAVKRVSWIHKVIEFPSELILAPVLNGTKSERQSLGDLARWIGPLVKEPWDMVINWSYSESSSYLTGILPARIKLGFSRRKDTSFCSLDGWSHYMQAIVQSGVTQNIHVTDILTTQILTALQIHFGEPENDGNAPVTSKSFFTLTTKSNEFSWHWRDLSRKWIAVQLDESPKRKSWSADSWAKFLHRILSKSPGHSVVLLGAKADQKKGQDILAILSHLLGQDPIASKQLLSLIGETDFDLWASVVSNCQWLISSDPSAIHLASVLGTRVLNVSIGDSRWVETGPYGNGHYIVTALRDGCDPNEVTPEAVYGAWTYAATEWSHRRQLSLEDHFQQMGMATVFKTARIFRSKIRTTQEGGGVYYEPLSSKSFREIDWMGMVIGHIARAWYCGWVPPVGQELSREKMGPILIQKLREIDESCRVLAQIYNEASLTAIALNKKSSKLKSDKIMGVQDRTEIQELHTKLQDLDALVERLGKTQPALSSFLNMSKVLMHNLRGEAMAELGAEAAASYRQLNEGVSIMREWLQYSLNLAKPVMVPLQASRQIRQELIP